MIGASPGIADEGERAAIAALPTSNWRSDIEEVGVEAFLDDGWPSRCSPGSS